VKLSEKELQVIAGVVADRYKEHTSVKEDDKHDIRLRNIKLLLKNYRSLVLHCDNIEKELIKFEDTSIQDLDLETINLESVESIKKSKKQSFAMMLFIKSKTEAYKRSCSTDELKYFRVMEMRYLTPKKYTIQEIAYKENIDRTTAGRYLEKAIEELPVIFFGAAAIKFEK